MLKGKKLLWMLLVLVVPVAYGGFAMTDGLEQTAHQDYTRKGPTNAWDKKINKATKRFKLVLGGEAVLDNETGLVWEKSPETTPRNWSDAISYAYNKTLGGRKGWRLPTVEELASLADPALSNPALPKGHPFTNVQSDTYWSSTTFVGNTNGAWTVYFYTGGVSVFNKSSNIYAWCVRGGYGYDGM